MSKNKTKILVVEDEPEQAKFIGKTVEKTLKYAAVVATNGAEALAQYKKNRTFFGFGENKIKAILLDINMPEMNGLDFLKQLRGIEKKNTFARYTPVIVITAHEEPEYIEDATNPVSGMVSAYLKKPFNKTELKDLLDKIIDNMDAEYMIEETRNASYERVETLRKENP